MIISLPGHMRRKERKTHTHTHALSWVTELLCAGNWKRKAWGGLYWETSSSLHFGMSCVVWWDESKWGWFLLSDVAITDSVQLLGVCWMTGCFLWHSARLMEAAELNTTEEFFKTLTGSDSKSDLWLWLRLLVPYPLSFSFSLLVSGVLQRAHLWHVA